MRPSMNRRPIHGRGMGVHAHSTPVWRPYRAPKVDTLPAIRRRFIDITPMESSKVANYTVCSPPQGRARYKSLCSPPQGGALYKRLCSPPQGVEQYKRLYSPDSKYSFRFNNNK